MKVFNNFIWKLFLRISCKSFHKLCALIPLTEERLQKGCNYDAIPGMCYSYVLLWTFYFTAVFLYQFVVGTLTVFLTKSSKKKIGETCFLYSRITWAISEVFLYIFNNKSKIENSWWFLATNATVDCKKGQYDEEKVMRWSNDN